MKQKSIGKNYIYNLTLTALNLIFPLITASYLSYVLGAENIGKVNYATSVINWFIIMASFGIPRYGIRAIARSRDSEENLAKTFWNLMIIQGVLSIISITIYVFIILKVGRFEGELQLHLIMVLMLLLNAFSLDWFYQGIEEYGYITIRSILFKIVSIILMFLLIKNKDDYILYALINIIGVSLNNVLNFIHSRKFVDRKIYNLDVWYYIKELKVYFVTTVVIAVYGTLDQLFIGTISPEELAYYVRSKTLLAVGTSITNSVITVLIPRSAYLMENNYGEYKRIIQQSINYIYLLGFPCVVGVFALAKDAMILLGGTEFIPAIGSLRIICILIVITAIGTWQVNQILLPYKKEKLALKMQMVAAVFSVTLNIMLIPQYSYIGAAITWTLTETLLVVIEGIIIHKQLTDIKIHYVNSSAIKYLISAGIMGVVVAGIAGSTTNTLITIAVSVVVAPVIYFGSILLLKDEVVLDMISDIFKRTKNGY